MNFQDRTIEASNLPKLDSFEKSKMQTALLLSFGRLQKLVNNQVLLHVHFKQHKATGRRAKHSVHLKLSFPGKTFIASESGWNAVNVLQKALKALEREAIESVKRH